jgi:hypothetical protein
MRKILNQPSVVTNSSATKLNSASVRGVSTETLAALAEVAENLKTEAAKIAVFIEEQVIDPSYSEGQDTVADRLIEWTGDIFAISEDINFYVNPKTEEK